MLTEGLSGKQEDYNTMAEDIVRTGMSVPGDKRRYNYGHGILLRQRDRDRLIRCLRAIISGKRGHPGKDDDDRMDEALLDLEAFEGELRKAKDDGKKNPKTTAYEELRKRWNLNTERQVRNRVSAANKLLPF